METSNIVLPDSSAADVTFKPLQKNGLLLTYSNLSISELSLRQKLTLGLRPSRGNTVAKTSMKIEVPYGTTLADGTTVYQSVQLHIDATVPPNAPTTSISDALAFASGYLQNDQVVDTVENEAFPY